MGTPLPLFDTRCAFFLRLRSAELKEIFCHGWATIHFPRIWVLWHQTTLLLLHLASVARAYWVHITKVARFLASITLP